MLKKKDYKKIIGFWVAVFFIGGFSGVFFGRTFLPWLTSFEPFNKLEWLCNVKDSTTIINKTEKLYISEVTAYQKAISSVGNTVVAVRIERAGKLLLESSGFILTNDGLIATASFSLAKGSKILVWRDGQEYEAQLIKQDPIEKIALIKIEANNLPVADFGDNKNLGLGDRLVLVGAVKADESLARFADIGIVKSLLPELTFSFNELALADGAPIATIEGKILGLALVEKGGDISLVNQEKIKQLMNK